VTGDGEVRSPLPSLMKFSVEPMLRSSRATPFGGSRLPLETRRRRVDWPSPA